MLTNPTTELHVSRYTPLPCSGARVVATKGLDPNEQQEEEVRRLSIKPFSPRDSAKTESLPVPHISLFSLSLPSLPAVPMYRILHRGPGTVHFHIGEKKWNGHEWFNDAELSDTARHDVTSRSRTTGKPVQVRTTPETPEYT